MKAKLITLTVLFILSACDVPQRTRYPSSSDIPINTVTDEAGEESPFNPGEETGTDQGSGDGAQDYGVGFEECNLGHRYNGGTIGNFGICQSSQSSRLFKISFQQPSLYEGTCVVPMSYNDGKSYQLGMPECVKNAADTVYTVPLTTYNYGVKVTAAMVIRYGQQGEVVNHFQSCMSAKQNYLRGNINWTYGTSCTNNGPDAYAQCVCNAFVDNYSDSYKQVIFED